MPGRASGTVRGPGRVQRHDGDVSVLRRVHGRRVRGVRERVGVRAHRVPVRPAAGDGGVVFGRREERGGVGGGLRRGSVRGVPAVGFGGGATCSGAVAVRYVGVEERVVELCCGVFDGYRLCASGEGGAGVGIVVAATLLYRFLLRKMRNSPPKTLTLVLPAEHMGVHPATGDGDGGVADDDANREDEAPGAWVAGHSEEMVSRTPIGAWASQEQPGSPRLARLASYRMDRVQEMMQAALGAPPSAEAMNGKC